MVYFDGPHSIGMWQPYGTPVDFRDAPVPYRSAEWEKRGVKVDELHRNSRYVQLMRGIWVDNDPDTAIPTPRWADQSWVQEWVRLSGALLLWPTVVGSSLTAARIYGLPLPNRIRDSRVHVATTDPNLKTRRPQVRLRRYLRYRRTEFFDLPLISATEAFLELAELLTCEELVAVGDAAVSRGHSGPFTSLEKLRAEAEGRNYLRSRKRIECALGLIRETVDSPRETWLRLWLIANGFPEPEVHPAVLCASGTITLHPDLGYPTIKLAIEYEGEQHRTSAVQFSRDIERRQLLEAEGWTVLRVAKDTDMAVFAVTLSSVLGRPAPARVG